MAIGSNTNGVNKLALGSNMLETNTTANANVATGRDALRANTTGQDNTAHGYRALLRNTTGSANVALDSGAGPNRTTGSNNVAVANRGQAGESGTIRIGTAAKQTAALIRRYQWRVGLGERPDGARQPERQARDRGRAFGLRRPVCQDCPTPRGRDRPASRAG